LGIVATWFGDLATLASWTADTVWPTQGPDGLKAFGVVDEQLDVYHSASIAHETALSNRDSKGDSFQAGVFFSTPWNPY
jgi:hypothetical protein